MTPDELATVMARAADADSIVKVVNNYAEGHRDQFAGVFVEQGGAVVALFTEPIGEHQAILRALVRPDAPLQVVAAEYSLADLEALKDRITASRQTLQGQGAFITGIGVDLRANQVVLSISLLDSASLASIEAGLAAGDMLQVRVTGHGGELLPRGALKVKAVDSAGRPVEGLVVELVPDVSGAYSSEMEFSTTANGTVVFPEVGATGYLVRLVRRGDDGASTVVGEGRVAVPAGGTGSIVVTVHAG